MWAFSVVSSTSVSIYWVKDCEVVSIKARKLTRFSKLDRPQRSTALKTAELLCSGDRQASEQVIEAREQVAEALQQSTNLTPR
jgi:hypothetical protein